MCINLNEYVYKLKGQRGYRRFSLKITYNEPVYIIFSENSGDKQANRHTFYFDRASKISFDPELSAQRYTMDLTLDSRGYSIWKDNGKGFACYRTFDYQGRSRKLAFFEDEFIDPDGFSPDITQVSFEVDPYKDMLIAKNILDERRPTNSGTKVYYAQHIRKGDAPSQFLYNGWFHFLMITLFTGRKHISDTDCPEELKSLFNDCKYKWLKMFHRCDDDWIKKRIFNLMSLVAADIGEEYYQIAHRYLDDYRNGTDRLPDYIGYSLDDGTTEHQKSLLRDILSIKKEKGVCILSKGVWGNEDLIMNIPIFTTLEYFDTAVDYLGELVNEVKNDRKKAKDITMCLEYVLCVFRLRSYNDKSLNKKLSLNNQKVRQLYKHVETLIENRIEIQSFLSLEITNKGVYEDVPNILYALLLYITGARGAGDIKIAGLSLEDLNT